MAEEKQESKYVVSSPISNSQPSENACLHGFDDSNVDWRERISAIIEFMTRLADLPPPKVGAQREKSWDGWKLFRVYWKLNWKIVDTCLIKAFYSIAANFFIRKNSTLARCYTSFAMLLEPFVGRTDIEFWDFALSSFVQKWSSFNKILTDHNLVMTLAKKIPCSCLDDEKEKAKRSPKTDSCGQCGERKESILLCEGCQQARYCSKKCQKILWRATHKYTCEFQAGIAGKTAK